MTVTVGSKPKPFAWSHSALHQFENCARQYYHTKIAKDFPEVQSDANKWGLQVHKAMADRIKTGAPLPSSMPYESWIDWATADLHEHEIIEAELQLAVTNDKVVFTPCKYFDRVVNPWFRTVADVLRIRGDRARIIDWKTGKNVDDNSDQLKLCAFAVFVHWPEVQSCTCQYVWLQHNNFSDCQLDRKDLLEFWHPMSHRVERMQQAIQDHEFPCRPSGLCKKHCGVRTCEYFGRGQY